MIDPMNIKSLRPARRYADLSQADLAKAAGTTANTIWRIENGRQEPKQKLWADIVSVIRAKLGEV